MSRPHSTGWLYVMRTSLGAAQLDAGATVAAYKSLSNVERAFRSIKTVDLHVRPVFHFTEAARARPRLPVHAGLLRRVAHARSA